MGNPASHPGIQAVTSKAGVHQCQRLPEIVILKAVGLGDKGSAGIEHFVLLMPSAELGTDHSPGKLEQLDPILRAYAGGLHIAAKIGERIGIAEVGNRRRNLQDSTTGQFPEEMDHPRIDLRLSCHRSVEKPRIGMHYAVAVGDGGRFRRRMRSVWERGMTCASGTGLPVEGEVNAISSG